MEIWVCAGWVLISNGDMGVCWGGVGQQWRHECVLGRCRYAMETWVFVVWMLISHGDGVCWVGADQQ